MKYRRRIRLRSALVGVIIAGVLAGASAAVAGGGFVPPPPLPHSKAIVNTSKFKKNAPWVIGYADASQSNSWRIMAKAEVDYGVSEFAGKVKLAYTNANDSTAKQISDVEDLISRHVNAIILAATDVNALCPSVAKAEAAGIPVLILERAVNCNNYTEFIDDQDNYNGYVQMAYIAWKLHGHGNIVEFGGQEGNGATVQALGAYASVLKKYPGIHVLATEYANYDPATGKQLMQALLVKYPKIDAVASISGNQGIGIFDAVQAAGRVKQIKAWSGDDANGWMKIVAKYHIPSVIAPIPTYAGRYAVEQAVKILEGKPVSQDFLVPKPTITEANIKTFARFDRPDEWWYSQNRLPCKFDPYCKH